VLQQCIRCTYTPSSSMQIFSIIIWGPEFNTSPQEPVSILLFDIKSYRLAYKRADSEESVGGWSFGGEIKEGGLRILLDYFQQKINIIWISHSSAQARLIGTEVPGHRNAWNAPQLATLDLSVGVLAEQAEGS